MRTFYLIALLFLSACAAQLPTSERLEKVRQEKQAALATEMNAQNLELGQAAFIRVFKYENTLETWVQDPATGRFVPYKSYPICNYSGTLGPKLQEGDKQSPEGFYTVGARQMNPWSQYQLSFNLGFPNEYDEALGRTGSALMIHGGCSSVGCYAMTDPVVEELYLLVEASIRAGHNVPVHVFPFRMTPPNMLARRGDQWMPFWENLKEGYDAFELTKIPPQISVRSGHSGAKYVIQRPKQQTIAMY